MKSYLYVLVVACSVTFLMTPLARRLARRIGAFTPVRDRDVHTVPTPRMGGTAMLVGFLVALLTASQLPFLAPLFRNPASWAVMAGATAVCLLGVADDLWGLDPLTKFAGQALIAGMMAWQGIQLVSLPIAGVTVASTATLMTLTVLVVLVTINAVNFVDGLDGLAAGIVGIAASAFFVYSYLLSRDARPDNYSSLATLVTAALVGCCLGFLPHNLHPSRVFMGDSGSMLIGLLLASATIVITGQVDSSVVSRAQIVPAFVPVALPLAVLALPLIDLVLAVLRRTRAGRSPFSPDKRHLHHRMLELGHSHARAVLIMYVWAATLAFGVVSVAFVPPLTSLALGMVSVVIATVLTLGPLRARRAAVASGRSAEPVPVPAPAEPGLFGGEPPASGGADDQPRPGHRLRAG